jgi:hypothetical protein
MTLRRLAPIAAVLTALALSQAGCVASAVGAAAGTAIGVTGAAVGGAAKLGGHAVMATGRAITPGHGDKDQK